jgi:predicted DNA-binding transcriptional regulator YafY
LADKDYSRLSRLIALLTQLQSKRLLTATVAAKKFGVSVRTIYRDIKTLEQAGVPVLVQAGKGFALMEGYRLPPVMLTEGEANAFITAEKLVLLNKDNSLIANYQEGLTKIKAVLKYDIQDKAAVLSDRVAFWENPTKSDQTSKLLSSIQMAITSFSLMHLEYHSSVTEETTKRLVEPFALINKISESWYLIAWCRLRKDFRLFRFDRIITIEMKSETFIPHQITLEEYLKNYRKKFS